MKYLIYIFPLLIFTSITPKFRDFHCANFFNTTKQVSYNERHCIGSEFVSKDFDKNNTGMLLYKYGKSTDKKYYLVEYHFINNVFCKGVKKTLFKYSLNNLDSAKVYNNEIRNKYEIAYGQKMQISKDSIFEKYTFNFKNDMRYNNRITLQLIKNDSIYVPLEIITPIIDDTSEQFWHKK